MFIWRTYCFDGASSGQTLLSDDDVVVSKADLWYDGAAEQFLQSPSSIGHQPQHIQIIVSFMLAVV